MWLQNTSPWSASHAVCGYTGNRAILDYGIIRYSFRPTAAKTGHIFYLTLKTTVMFSNMSDDAKHPMYQHQNWWGLYRTWRLHYPKYILIQIKITKILYILNKTFTCDLSVYDQMCSNWWTLSIPGVPGALGLALVDPDLTEPITWYLSWDNIE